MTFNPNKMTEPPRPIRPAPIPPSMIDEEKKKTIPPTPGRQRAQELSPRLRLEPQNFRNDRVQRDDSYYEKKIFEELRQRSYITKHPTSQYHGSTEEIKRVYDGFEKTDYLEEMKKKRQEVQQRGEEEGEEEGEVEGCTNSTTMLQRLLTMSLHYAPDFFKTLTTQTRDELREQKWPEAQVQQREQELRDTKLLELYTIILQK
eukprot:6436275-Amphidinium_carterae.5